MYRNKTRTLKIMKVALLYCAMTKNCSGTVSLLEKILGVGHCPSIFDYTVGYSAISVSFSGS